MPSESSARWPECNCLALRQAARQVSQFYDRYLASTGLRTTQFSILAKLKGLGPMTINALARELGVSETELQQLSEAGVLVTHRRALETEAAAKPPVPAGQAA